MLVIADGNLDLTPRVRVDLFVQTGAKGFTGFCGILAIIAVLFDFSDI